MHSNFNYIKMYIQSIFHKSSVKSPSFTSLHLKKIKKNGPFFMPIFFSKPNSFSTNPKTETFIE